MTPLEQAQADLWVLTDELTNRSPGGDIYEDRRHEVLEGVAALTVVIAYLSTDRLRGTSPLEAARLAFVQVSG